MTDSDSKPSVEDSPPPKRDLSDYQKRIAELPDSLIERLIHLRDDPPHPDMKVDDWLRTLYSTYFHRFLSDNSRIWMTATLMVPISLAAFAGVATLKPITTLGLLTLGLPSIVLITLWLFIADKHRVFQERSEEILSAIEEVIEFSRRPRSRSRWGAVRLSRWLLVGAVWVGWLFLFAANPLGLQVQPVQLDVPSIVETARESMPRVTGVQHSNWTLMSLQFNANSNTYELLLTETSSSKTYALTVTTSGRIINVLKP
jgi:hypothetical protein